MNAEIGSSAACEINRLHADVVRRATASRASLDGALSSAWHAGQLLLTEKRRVRRTMGGGAWLLWLRENFRGTPRTAQRYMRLASSVSNVSFLSGMSLRQAYERLGIATEPKSRAACAALPRLPAHARLAHRLLVALRPCARRRLESEAGRDAFRQVLRPLYEELRRLFEGDAAGFSRLKQRHGHIS